jgi:lipopolysaccharide export system protein LptA
MGAEKVKFSRSVILWLLAALILAAAPDLGAAAPKPAAKAAASKAGGKEDVPLQINAARLEADQNQGVIVFSGKVRAVYGDATLYADELRVFFKAQPQAAKAAVPAPAKKTPAASAADAAGPLGDLGGQKIDRIVAHGQVRLVQEDRVATGQEAIYYKDRDEVVLLGNPQLWRAENTLKGERIVVNLKTNRMTVESSPKKRVEAVLYSQGAPGSLPTGAAPRKGPKR